MTTKAAVVQAAVVVIGLFSVMLAALQVRVTAAWNKVLSYHNFFGDLVTPAVRRELHRMSKDCFFEEALLKAKAISDDAVSAIIKSAEADAIVTCYLDEFEEFCGALNAGVVDAEYGYKLEGSRVVRTWIVFQPFISKCRSDGSPNAYLQLEHLGKVWVERKNAEATRAAASGRMSNHV